eukprot:scaffold2466_cov40-Attheya_sp.AAC.2
MWKTQSLYPFTTSMSITRFRQIRSIIHLNDNDCQHTSKKDSLVRIRPLLNVLKRTLGSCLDIGDELSVDEASVASKSKYGRVFIMYNPMKPGGDNYNLVRFTMHTRTNADLADGFNTALDDNISDDEYDAPPDSLGNEEDAVSDDDVDDVTPLQQKPKKLNTEDAESDADVEDGPTVKKQKKKKKSTWRTVNMDRFYGGPKAAMALLDKGLLCRGTFKTNRKLTPHSVRFSKKDADNYPRGSYRMAVALKEHMSIFGWNDGCPVHMLSTADGTKIGSVQRQIGSVSQTVKAPVVVPRYNKGMQGVDRHDQLRNLFALSQRHQFQKYYMTLIMALIDFAVVNANIHYHMVHPILKQSSEHRAIFMQSLSLGLRNANWRQLQEAHYRGIGSQVGEQTLYENGRPNIHVRRMLGLEKPTEIVNPNTEDLLCRHVSSPRCNPRACTDLDLPKAGQACQICYYEGRGRKYNGVTYCYKHGSKTCVTVHEDSHIQSSLRLGVRASLLKVPLGMDYSTWLCPYPDLTCWEKHHQFYERHDLFVVNAVDGELPTGKVNRTAALYKARNRFIQQCMTKFCPSSPTDAFSNQELPRRISPRRILLRNTPMSSMNGREHRSGAVTSPAYQGTSV